MRKYIVPILVAGALAFTAAQAMALDNSKSGSFEEIHLNGDHYKKTDALENGGHGPGEGYQLSSAWLKSVMLFQTEGDASYGYSTGNPFRAGYAGGPGGETDFVMVPPSYTMPCPEWIGPGGNGDCPANTFATDPQTEDPIGIWDGVVLDDLYQVVAADDSGTQTSTNTNLIVGNRFLNQTIDILFYNGKRGIITLGTSGPLHGSADGVIDDLDGTGPGNHDGQRHFNIDQTLDQDIADYFTEYEGLNTTDDPGEVAGIFGKLTQLFQLAGPASTAVGGYADGTKGCASGGRGETSDSLGAGACPDNGQDGTVYGLDVNEDDVLATALIDQWVVQDVADLHLHEGKPIGSGVDQRYRSWFRDGDEKDFNYTYEYPAGHGDINKTVKPIDHPFDP